jgi:hypothetical protein
MLVRSITTPLDYAPAIEFQSLVEPLHLWAVGEAGFLESDRWSWWGDAGKDGMSRTT